MQSTLFAPSATYEVECGVSFSDGTIHALHHRTGHSLISGISSIAKEECGRRETMSLTQDMSDDPRLKKT